MNYSVEQLDESQLRQFSFLNYSSSNGQLINTKSKKKH